MGLRMLGAVGLPPRPGGVVKGRLGRQLLPQQRRRPSGVVKGRPGSGTLLLSGLELVAKGRSRSETMLLSGLELVGGPMTEMVRPGIGTVLLSGLELV